VPVFDFEICNACADKKCMQTCYTSAISESGKDYSIQEVFDIIKKDKPFYDNSGGGITLSGGEPLMQPTAVFELLKLCKEAHIHTAIETCGFARQEIILKIAEKTDLFLFDIKIIDDEKHITYTGRSNQQIISNIEALSSINKPIIARIPLIPEITDTLENITQIIELCKKNNIQEATLGIYHNLGIQKYTDFGMPCYFSEDPPLNQNEKYLQYCELFKSNGIACEIL
jgi:pyruvate formate lyase activating enzyme